jgi:hypothetical protein
MKAPLEAVLRVALAASLIAGCHESPTAPAERLPFRVVVKGSIGLRAPIARTEVIASTARWQQVWSETGFGDQPGHPAPEIDFSRETLLYATRGPQPDSCYGMAFVAVTRMSKRVEAVVEQSDPLACICAQVVTHPIEVIAIPAVAEPVSFRLTRNVKRCAG